MENQTEIIRPLLVKLGFDSDLITAGIAALNGAPNETPQNEPLLTPRQLCSRLQISSTTLWRLQPPFLRVAGRKRFVWSEVQQFLAERQGSNVEM